MIRKGQEAEDLTSFAMKHTTSTNWLAWIVVGFHELNMLYSSIIQIRTHHMNNLFISEFIVISVKPHLLLAKLCKLC